MYKDICIKNMSISTFIFEMHICIPCTYAYTHTRIHAFVFMHAFMAMTCSLALDVTTADESCSRAHPRAWGSPRRGHSQVQICEPTMEIRSGTDIWGFDQSWGSGV